MDWLAVAGALAKLADSRGIECLVHHLLDDNYWINRKCAAENLAGVGDFRAISALVAALRDINPDVRQTAVTALTDSRILQAHTQFIRVHLTGVLADEYPDTRRAAALAVSQLGGPRWAELVAGADPELMRPEKCSDPLAVETIAAVVANIGLSSNPLAEPGMVHNALTVKELLRVFDCANATVATPELDQQFKQRLQQACERALAAILDGGTAEPLINALNSPQEKTRSFAASALGRLGVRSAVDPLIRLLHDTEPSVLVSAAAALGDLGDSRAVGPLIGILKDKKPDIRAAAKSALMALLPDTEPSVLVSAAAALDGFADSQAVAPLIQILRDKGFAIRAAATSALVASTAPIGREPPVHTWKTSDPLYRRSAVTALGLVGDRETLDLLSRASRDGDGVVRSAAVASIGNLTRRLGIDHSKALEDLLQALHDTNSDVRCAAIVALGTLGDPEALAHLNATRSDESVLVRDAVVLALCAIDSTVPHAWPKCRCPRCGQESGLHSLRSKISSMLGKYSPQLTVEDIRALLQVLGIQRSSPDCARLSVEEVLAEIWAAVCKWPGKTIIEIRHLCDDPCQDAVVVITNFGGGLGHADTYTRVSGGDWRKVHEGWAP